MQADANSPRAASSFWPITSRFAPPSERKTAAVGSLIATGSPSHAAGAFTAAGEARSRVRRWLFSRSACVFPANTSGGGHLSPARVCSSSRTLSRFSSVEPHNLERIVPFDQAVLIVVDRLAGPGEQPGRGVVLAQNQLRIGIGTLQRNANCHLVDGAAGKRVCTAESLRAEQHVEAERAALPHEAVEQKRCFLGELVVLDEELLELVHDQENPRHSFIWPCGSVACEIVHAGIAELVAAFLEDAIEPLQHAEAELAFALDRDDAGVRQSVRRVALELDALLEVDRGTVLPRRGCRSVRGW